jgi:ATP-dependent exoDNAse (exonuclease V) beta subunit
MTPKFTSEQLSAIEYLRRDTCVVAGPGSGKTTVLVERYSQLVTIHNFDTRQILAITFTEKAAANMKAKLAEQFKDDPVRLRDLESSSWVSTIHGFCARLLKENAIAASLDPRFTVLSPRESEKLQWECLQRALDDLTEQRREQTLALIDALQSPRLSGELMDVYDAMRSAGLAVADVRAMRSSLGATSTSSQSVDELREIVRHWPFDITVKQREEKNRILEWCQRFEEAGEEDFAGFMVLLDELNLNLNKVPRTSKEVIREFRDRLDNVITAAVDRYALPFRELIFDVLARFDEDYTNRKAALGKVDFNDLERHAIALLEGSSEVKSRIHKMFRQIMLDEFQDINGQQNKLIEHLRSEDVFFGVGDRNQSIYGFRYARPEIFTNYHDKVSGGAGQSVSLHHNFRSRTAILNCVKEVLSGKQGIDEFELVPGARFAAKDEPAVEVMKIHAAADDDDKDAPAEREAEWIAHRINQLRGALQLGAPGETRAAEFRDFAVLCRAGDSMLPILAAFDHAGIPYVCGRRQSFLLSREGLDITALLHVIGNPRDSISLAGLLRSPLVGLSDDGLLRLRLLAHSLTSGLNTFPYSRETEDFGADDAEKLRAFCRNLERWRSDQPVVALDILLSRALTDCGVAWLPESAAGANIESFLHLARTTGASMDLQSFLQELESLANAAGTESELSDQDQGNCVQVMTAHAAKGLEFGITIIAAMDKGPRRESRPVTFTPEHGLGVKWRNPASKGGKGGSGKGFKDDALKDSWAERNSQVLRDRETHEEHRLLYVAMTRAEEHLILSYSCRKGKPQNWAGIVDEYFRLAEVTPAPEPRRESCNGFDASILVSDSDPPHLPHPRAEVAGTDIQLVAPPVIDDQHETTATVTSLAAFGVCPRKYYIQHSLGWSSGRFRRFDPDAFSDDLADDGTADDSLSASRTGSAVHEILAGVTSADSPPEARQLAEVFLKSPLGLRAAAAARVEREWAFILDIDGTIVRGSIDLWFEEDGEVRIVDYKTDAHVKPDDYVPQLALYSIALERATGTRPKVAWLHFLRSNTVVEIALDDATLRSARALVSGLREAQDKLRFDLNEGEHCRTCRFYRSLCPAGRQPAL